MRSMRDRDRKLVRSKTEALIQNPRPPGCEKVEVISGNCYRVRAGNWRVFYFVYDDTHRVTIEEVRLRNESTYRFTYT